MLTYLPPRELKYSQSKQSNAKAIRNFGLKLHGTLVIVVREFVADCCEYMADSCEYMADRCEYVADRCEYMADCCEYMADCCEYVADCCEYVPHSVLRAGWSLTSDSIKASD